MNDRAASVLENYEIEVLRTWKGRGAILCESDKGLLILKEYTGPLEKIFFQDTLLSSIKEQGFQMVESIMKTRDGEFIVYDQDRTPYILKTYFAGRECNIRDKNECIQAVKTLARLHNVSFIPNETYEEQEEPVYKIDKEYEKHNKELRKVRKFLRDKSQKTNFEIYLLKYYDYFLDLALKVTDELNMYLDDLSTSEDYISYNVCHGDYQYHNIIVVNNEDAKTDQDNMAIINFEKCTEDSPVRDLYLFMRKLLEKNNWSEELGFSLIEAYSEERDLTPADYTQLYYRFIYPEKFWKIVNFYYNSGKAWIPGRNLEKLEKLLDQEQAKVKFLEKYKSLYGCFSFEAH